MKKGIIIRNTKFVFLVCLMIIGVYNANAQVSAMVNNPDKSAALDLSGTNKGLLIPRLALVNLTDKTIINGGNPAKGLLVYNTNVALTGGAGFFYWNGSSWYKLFTTDDIVANSWNLDGNSNTNPSTNFIGTKDNVDFVFRTNNTEKGRFSAAGNLGLGTTTPKGKLSIYNGQLSFDQAVEADKIWMFGDTNHTKIGAETDWTLTNYAGEITSANTGKFSWKTVNTAGSFVEKMTLDNSGSLTVSNKVDTQQARIAKGTDGVAPVPGYIAISNDASGNLVWRDPATITNSLPARYNLSLDNVAVGDSKTIASGSRSDTYMMVVKITNACGSSAIANFMVYKDVITSLGGQASSIPYVAVVLDASGNSLQLKAQTAVPDCNLGGGALQFNFDILMASKNITITNRGDDSRTYEVSVVEM